MIKGIIDRFEGEYAIVEIEGEIKVVQRSDLPAPAREGDVIIFNKNKWFIDDEATQKLKENITKQVDELWEN